MKHPSPRRPPGEAAPGASEPTAHRPGVIPGATGSVRTLTPALAHFRASGGNVGALLGEFGLPPDAVTNLSVHLRLPHATLVDLLRRATEISGDPLFGLRAAFDFDFVVLAKIDIETPFLPFQLFVNSATVADALERYARYYAVAHDTARVVFERDATSGRVHYEIPGDPLPFPGHVELVLGMILKALRDVSSVPLAPTEVHFAHAAQAPVPEYERLLGAKVHFETERSGFVLDSAGLDVALCTPRPALLRALERSAAALLGGEPPRHTLAEQVRASLAASLARGVPRPEETARGLSMSARTLSRYLGAAGTSHQQLLDEVRAGLAHRYLVDDGRPVEEVARMLGYSEVSAFRRAFRRWYGRPPADYRASTPRGKPHP